VRRFIGVRAAVGSNCRAWDGAPRCLRFRTRGHCPQVTVWVAKDVGEDVDPHYDRESEMADIEVWITLSGGRSVGGYPACNLLENPSGRRWAVEGLKGPMCLCANLAGSCN
jgi:hypothetical protein